jgi:hypothetical protein
MSKVDQKDTDDFTDDDIETLRKILFNKRGRLKTQYAVIFGGFGGGLLLKAHKYSPEEQRSLIENALKSTKIGIKLAKLII